MQRDMVDLVTPEQVPTYVPGEILLDSEAVGWNDGMTARAYRYGASEVTAPPLRDFLVIAYRQGFTRMRRRIDGGPWRLERMAPGKISILTRAEPSCWYWDAPIDVIHVYLTRNQLAKISAETFDRDIADVHLNDVLSAQDDVVSHGLNAIANEVQTSNIGGKLYADAVATQLSVHLLRHYANVSLCEPRSVHGLSHVQARILDSYIESNFDRQLSLEELASVTRTSASHFLRQFKTRYGMPPHAYVLKRRLEHAQNLLRRTRLPIKDISARAGFSDQSHMTRVFQRFLGTTPHQYRQTTTRA
ncbi:MAG: AraC family transcriptional regulator [Rudaea sp.]|uniref:helix-turn-helix domain-containing protein n=1 Tax=Rudaea sp. TaxID=2136325 RepID=UPI0039E6B398